MIKAPRVGGMVGYKDCNPISYDPDAPWVYSHARASSITQTSSQNTVKGFTLYLDNEGPR